jgi:hypothetical protein
MKAMLEQDEKKKNKFKADIPVKHFLIDLNYL